MDAAATAKYENIDNTIVDTIIDAMKNAWQNPSSLYASSVKDKINKCRSNIAKFIGSKNNEIYFTSGASESNSWAITGWINECKSYDNCPINVITTKIEHKSILNAVNNSSAIVRYCNVDEFGFADCEHLESILMICDNNKEPILVSVGMANNEIGTIQNIKGISELVHRYNGVLHVDATQVFGHIPFDVEELGIDMMSCSGHKLSPVLKGIGFLYKKDSINIQPIIYGTQENGMRGGTENTYGIIGLSKAVELCDFSADKINDVVEKRNYFIDLLKSKFGCKLNGHCTYRLLNNINVTFAQNITAESLLYVLDMGGIKISVGSACNSKSYEPSHVLKAIGLSDEDAMKTVRFTLPNNISHSDIDYVINEIEKSIKLIETN